MKKVLYTVGIILMLVGCSQDTFELVDPIQMVPESMEMIEVRGIKLETVFVSDKVSVNVKLDKGAQVRLKIRDISGKLVSQERLTAREGNNLLSIYTNSLEKSSYTVELTTDEGNVLGSDIFVIQ
jgi:hypothetical protein